MKHKSNPQYFLSFNGSEKLNKKEFVVREFKQQKKNALKRKQKCTNWKLQLTKIQNEKNQNYCHLNDGYMCVCVMGCITVVQKKNISLSFLVNKIDYCGL